MFLFVWKPLKLITLVCVCVCYGGVYVSARVSLHVPYTYVCMCLLSVR